MFYVYVWYAGDVPFYVGKGKGSRAYSKNKNIFFKRKLKKCEECGIQVNVRIEYANLTETEAFIIEKKLIRKYGRRNNGSGILTNLTDGGEGISGMSHTASTKNIISSKAFGRKASNKTRDKMSRSRREYFEHNVVSETTRKLLSENIKGQNNPMSILNDQLVYKILDLLVEGKTNKEIEVVTGVKHYIISDIRYGKKWKHLYNTHEIKNIKLPKVTGHANYDMDFMLSVIEEIIGNKISKKKISEKYNLRYNLIIQIGLKITWKTAWNLYEYRNDYRKPNSGETPE